MRCRGVPDRACRMAVLSRKVGTPLSCADCALPLVREMGRQGRQKERCGPCAVKHARAYIRDYMRRRRGSKLAEYPPEDCRDCGAPNNDGEPGRCPECGAR